MTPAMRDQIILFVNLLQELYNKHYAEHMSMLTPPVISFETGRKFVRIVCSDGQRMVYCFIDSTNGDILKSAGWKAPAKGARGNIFNPNCDVGVKADVYGAGLYMRG